MNAARGGMIMVALAMAAWLAGMVFGFKAAVSILTLLGFTAAVAGYAWPGLAMCGITILTVIDPLTRVFLLEGGLLRWNSFNYILLAVVLLNAKGLLRLPFAQVRILMVFIFFLALGLIFTPNFESGLLDVINVTAALGILVYFIRSSPDERTWYWQGLLGGILGAAGGFIFFMQRTSLPPINENAWAYFPLTAIFTLSLGIISAPPGWLGKPLLSLLAVTNMGWLYLIGSRGGMLVSLACMIFITLRSSGGLQRALIVGIGALIILNVTGRFSDYSARTESRIDRLLDPDVSSTKATSGRSDLAKGGWYIFLDHPFGTGTGGFSYAWARLGFKDDLSGFGYGEEKPAHSGWIKTLVDLGIQGFLVLSAFVLSFLVTGWKGKMKPGVLGVGALATVVLAVAFLSTEFASKGLWYFVAGSIVWMRTRELARKQKRVPDTVLATSEVS